MGDNNLQFNVVMKNPENNERKMFTTDSLRDAVVLSYKDKQVIPECIRIYDREGKFVAVFDRPDIFALHCAREYLK